MDYYCICIKEFSRNAYAVWPAGPCEFWLSRIRAGTSIDALIKTELLRPPVKESKSRYKDPLPQRKEAGASKHLLKSTETKLHRVEKEKIIEEKPKAVSKEDATASSVKKHSQEEIEAMFPTQLSQDNKELDPSTAKILEYELRHIMIKVWQEFPDDPPTEEEMYVAEKFRNEAGDDIRNVIGLNVSKRLLNTYNKLIVKVRFSCRPEKLNLLAFLKKYRITGFKRITSATNTFAALLKNIDDFDKICSEKEISCGNAKLTITPCYNFMKRPSHLKTKFVDETDNETVTEAKVAQENFGKEIAEIKPNTEVKEAPKDTVIKEASQNKIERDDNKQTLTRDEVSVAKDIQGKSTKSDHITKVSNITPTNKSQDKSNISNKKVVGEKPTQKSLQEKVTAKPITNETAKSTVTSTKNNTAITQSQKVQTPQNKSQTKGNSIKSVQVKETPKVIKKIDVKDATFKTTESKVKQKVNKKVAVKKKEVKSTNQIKRIPMSKVQKNKKGIIDKYNDYDEMDDDDILAFLADGVVMDECSTDEE